jgi:outer membrane protein
VKNLKKMMLAAVVAASPVLAMAEGKIAVFSAQQAIMNTDAAKAQVKAFQQEPSVAEKIKEFEGLQKKYKEAVEQVQKDLAMMSAEQKQTESKKINDMRADIEHVGRQLKQSEQEMAQRLMQEFGPRLQPILAELVKNESIGLLLDKKAALHADASFDITAKVTDKLNQGQ